MAVGAKILSHVYCKKGSDGKGAVSPEREGRTSASHWCFTLGSVEGFQLHLVVWKQGCLGGSKHILGIQIRLWAVKTAAEPWLVKEAALSLSVWGVTRADVLVGSAGLVLGAALCARVVGGALWPGARSKAVPLPVNRSCSENAI